MVVPASADDERLTVSRSEAAQRIQKQIDRLQMSVAQHNSDFERTTLEAPSQQRLQRSQVLGSYARALEVFRDFTSELLFRLFTSLRLKEMFVSSDESAQKLVDPIALGRVIHELVERVDLDILSKLNVVASEWRFRLETIAERLELLPEPPPTPTSEAVGAGQRARELLRPRA